MTERMDRWFRRALQGAALLCAVWVGGMPDAEARVALVVGNSAYQHTDPLDNPSNDAEDMAKQLRRLGFEVIEGRDLTEDGFYDHLRKFSEALHRTKDGEAALFFFAGHGIQNDEAENYLVPVDVALRDKWSIRDMVRLDDVMEAMEEFSGLKLVFLDACRDNPLRGKRTMGGGGKRGLAPVTVRDGGAAGESSGTVIVYATAPDDTADDGEGSRNSPFTGALLKHIGTPGLEVGEMLDQVTGTVIERTRHTGKPQVPWVSRSRVGKFYFASGSGRTEVGGAGTTADTAASSNEARVAYELAEKIHTRAAYEAIAAGFPGTVYAQLAEAQIEKLRGGDGDSLPESPSAGDGPPVGESTEGEDRARDLTLEEGVLVQRALASLGFAPGLVDGHVGPKTREALRSWQKKKGYAETGRLSAEQSRVLLAVGREAQARQDAEAVRRAEEVRAAAATEARRKREEAEAKRQAEEERRRAEARRIAELAPEMVDIEGGCFQMGSPESEAGRYANERRHRMCVEAFSIGKYEVTFAEYDRFAEATGRARPDDEGWGREDRPVINVSWDDATAYARWLSGETGERYRLPTEAEWEYAARAGSTKAYPWGSSVGRGRANCRGCGSEWDGRRQPAPVGSFDGNAWGVHDTVGNVREWTCSGYDEGYGGGEKRCAAGSARRYRVLRGGAWGSRPGGVRSAYRDRIVTGYGLNTLGFRLVQD